MSTTRRLHDRALELAAAALDFGLAPAELAELDGHLATCPACARTTGGLRGDLALLRHPATLLPPRRVDDAVHAAIAGRDPRTSPQRLFVLVAATALLLAALLGVAAAGALLLQRRPPAVVVDPSPSVPAVVVVDPSASPDALIAYMGGAEGAHVVKTIRSDGSDEQTLAEGESPAWSPDGRSIAYVCRVAEAAARGGLPDTCVMGADGTNQRVVATGAITPSWSPDGAQLLFGRSAIDMGDTWVADADGSNARKVGDGKGSWSPDGAWILLLGASGATADATIVRPDGTGARKLGDCWEAAWSPDGISLACTGWNEVERRGVLRVISIEDTSLYLFEEDATLSRPTWVSADKIAFTMSAVGSPPGAAEQYLHLLVLRADGPRRLMQPPVTGPISVASDGTSLATSGGTGETSDVYVVSPSGEALRLTTDGVSSAPRWQPRPGTGSATPSATPSASPTPGGTPGPVPGIVGVIPEIAFSAFVGQPRGVDLAALVQGPDAAPYVLDRATDAVYRISVGAKRAIEVFRAGQTIRGRTTSAPTLLAVGGPDVLVLDEKNILWRWRPAGAGGGGTLDWIRFAESTTWGQDVSAIGTFVRNEEAGLYNVYVVDPSAQQTLRYAPAADGSGYPAAGTGYLTTPRDVSKVTGMYVDGDVFLADGGSIVRLRNGSETEWKPGEAGDEVLPAPRDYRFVSSPAARGEGVLYAFDAANQRLVAFDKAAGTFLAQYQAGHTTVDWHDVRGFYVVDRGATLAPVIWWIDDGRLLSAELAASGQGASASPSP